MSTEGKKGFDTLRIHAGYEPKEHLGSVQVPIYQTTAFDIGSPERAERLVHFEEVGLLYSRIGNPTVAALEQRVAALDGGVAAVAVASGMAALSYALLAAGEGGRVIAAARIYGGTYDGYRKVYPALGVEIDLIDDVNDLEALEGLIRPDTRAIVIESISNPINIVADIQAIADVAHSHGIPLIVDNTLATPYLLRPIEYGADIVVYSATKALSGHGSIIGGLIVEAPKRFNWLGGRHPQFAKPVYTFGNRNVVETFPDFPFSARVRTHYLAILGASLSPFDAYLILQGIETLSERLHRQSASALAIAEYLAKHPRVEWVSHPLLPESPYRQLAKQYLPKGVGGIFSFGYKGDGKENYRFLNALKLFSYHANLGDARSLIINSPHTTHHELTPEELKATGVVPETLRLSIGLEDVADLIADLEQAFAKAVDTVN
ncbi:MAG: aminotransferase class I/II-fold pyridoxal phosphate-dependent enzyme [Tannerellaceae bacterium]|jgi:O-acetylhomoserine (thiol)-lyase|nr:aminotransferase class I/II-fold pyridoxal phosphate-dependent enzyme [Tannerellaceae bacterium]